MTWQWRATGPGREMSSTGPAFDSQELAEQWLTASYEDLVDEGWDAVYLFDSDRCVYGPMSLSAQ